MSVFAIPIEKAQEELTALLKDAAQSMHHYILTNKEGPIGTLMSVSEYDKLMRQNKFVRKREQYLRILIEEGIGIDELRSTLQKMDKIDKVFESGKTEVLMKEADEYAEKMVKEWCAKHGLEYNPTDEESAQEFINVAVKRVRAEGK
ncbi:type II toxin-antitoxin system prevent-host-death family antitoxin [Candidatus Poribacteria bacterium]|nr:type II toxin-antitoxin system prevent-host-death family antitoxin [Candidatus Poribacteria bacterium]